MRRSAVVGVVAFDVVQNLLTAAGKPAFEHHDRVIAALYAGGALQAVERFELLERIAWLRDAQCLPYHGKEIDKDAVAQQIVELVLASTVETHEPAQRDGLV